MVRKVTILFLNVIVAVILMGSVTVAVGFNYSNYKQSNLKEIWANMISPLANEHKEGVSFLFEPYKVRIRLPHYPRPVDSRVLRAFEYYSKVTNNLTMGQLKIFAHQVDV